MIRWGGSGKQINLPTVKYLEWVRELGLNAYETNFGHGMRVGRETAIEIGKVARENGIALSVHAPYYINLASCDDEIVLKSYGHIKRGLEILNWLDASDGARRLVIHVGAQCKLDRETALKNAHRNLKQVVEKLKQEGFKNFYLCIEVMGRFSEIGNVAEICELCKIDACIIPTVDWGHVNCITGGELKRRPEKMCEIMDEITELIGIEKVKNLHMHFSAITYTPKGEQKHTNLDDEKWNFDFAPLGKYIFEKKLQPTIICESNLTMATDCVKLKHAFKFSN